MRSKILQKLVEFETFSDVIVSNCGKSQIQCFVFIWGLKHDIHYFLCKEVFLYKQECLFLEKLVSWLKQMLFLWKSLIQDRAGDAKHD